MGDARLVCPVAREGSLTSRGGTRDIHPSCEGQAHPAFSSERARRGPRSSPEAPETRHRAALTGGDTHASQQTDLQELRQTSFTTEQILADLTSQTSRHSQTADEFESVLTTFRSTGPELFERMRSEAAESTGAILSELRMDIDSLKLQMKQEVEEWL